MNRVGASMDETLFKLYLIRHGDTAWAETHKHTGLTDIPLNVSGEQHARLLGERLNNLKFSRIFTSPLLRARRTCELAGFGKQAELDPDLVEWNYGDYEGRTTADIRRDRPNWDLFRDGCPNGEMLRNVAARADRFINKVRSEQGDVIAFSSGHIIRVIAAQWLSIGPEVGRCFLCSTASIGILGYEHDRSEPVIRLWNDHGELN
jgi:broad specificity phosphatase PhoE